MRRFFSVIGLFVGCLVVLSGCSSSKVAAGLNFEVYFPSVSATTFTNETKAFQTKEVIAGEMSQDRYSYVSLSGAPEWIYGLTIESFSFVVVANENVELDLLIEFINVETGTETISGTKRFRTTAIKTLTSGKESTVSIQVNDCFPSKTGSIKISINDATPFSESGDLKWTIVGMSFSAKH